MVDPIVEMLREQLPERAEVRAFGDLLFGCDVELDGVEAGVLIGSDDGVHEVRLGAYAKSDAGEVFTVETDEEVVDEIVGWLRSRTYSGTGEW